MTMSEKVDDEELKKLAVDAIEVGVETADPFNCILDNVTIREGRLSVADESFALEHYKKIKVFGFGKASARMAEAVSHLLDVDGGVIITDKESKNITAPDNISILQADHPLPTERNVQATDRLLRAAEETDEDTLSILLISGGGSAMLCSPPEGISLEDVRELNSLLIESGRNIKEINTVRKHVSQVKGGKLCTFLRGDVITLIISDVVGNDISSIASGPTSPDEYSFLDAFIILEENGLMDKVPETIKNHINRGIMEEMEDTLKTIPDRVHNFILGDNLMALDGIKKYLEDEGMNVLILTSRNEGTAVETARSYTAIAKEVQDSGNPISVPAAIVAGGEMIVKGEIPEKNRGGPNREFVLQSALEIENRKNIVVAAADSDGIDGKGKAGAVADGTTIRRADTDPSGSLAEHSTEEFFDSISDSIEFDSDTNVNDIIVILIR